MLLVVLKRVLALRRPVLCFPFWVPKRPHSDGPLPGILVDDIVLGQGDEMAGLKSFLGLFLFVFHKEFLETKLFFPPVLKRDEVFFQLLPSHTVVWGPWSWVGSFRRGGLVAFAGKCAAGWAKKGLGRLNCLMISSFGL